MTDLSQKCRVKVPAGSDFSIYNLPYGIFSAENTEKKVGVAIGEKVLDLHWLQVNGFFSHLNLEEEIFLNEFLNDFISTGKNNWAEVRKTVQELLTSDDSSLSTEGKAFHNQSDVIMHLPVKVGDYTDFYSSKEHATNVGTMFRGADNALMPNWSHIPVGYHGRSSSIVVSGTPIHRPKGQTLPPNSDTPVFGPTRLLDIELEMAFVVGKETALGEHVEVADAEDHIFGMVIFNDWSARDIQKWEYVPLGPFLGKNFGSSISPWLVTMDALEPFRTAGPIQDPPVLPYLQFEGKRSFDIQLEVYLKLENGSEQRICNSNHKYLYWNIAQQLAHHTVNGCNIRVGDMCASGTISGPEPENYGSLLELTWRGEKSLKLQDGTERKFLQDGDTIVMKAFCESGGIRIGFGEVRTQILPTL